MTSPASVFESVLVSITGVHVWSIDRAGVYVIGVVTDDEVNGVSLLSAVPVLITGPLPLTSAWVIVWLTTRSWPAPGARVAISFAGFPVSGSVHSFPTRRSSDLFETCRL